MSVDGYDLSDDVDLPRLAAAAIRAEPWVASFFGPAGIREHDDSEVSGWTPAPPYVAVLPGTMRETRAAGDVVRATMGVRVLVYLQTMIPTAPWITPPQAPTAATGSAGALTGTRLYAVTAYDGSGESCVLDTGGIVATSLPVTYAAQRGTITMPAVTGVSGLRLWATRLGGKAFYFHSLAASGAVVTDNLLDTELSLEMAPIRFLGRRLVSAVKRALVTRERMDGKAFAAMAFDGDTTRAENGVQVHEFQAFVPLRMDVTTRESTV